MPRIASLLLLLLAVSACTGGGWQDALSADDRSMMAEAMQTALEFTRTGEGTNWANPASGNLGTVTPTRTWQSGDERDCRDYQQTVTVVGTTRVGYASACRAASGVWIDRRSPIYDTPAAYDDAVRTRLTIGFGFGYGHHFGHGHYGLGHHYPFGYDPWYDYRYGYPRYHWY
jgi:surface antigen